MKRTPHLALLLLLLALALVVQACIGRPRTRGGGGGGPGDPSNDDDDAANDDDAASDDDDAVDFNPNMWGEAYGSLDWLDSYQEGQGTSEFEVDPDGYATGELTIDFGEVSCELFLVDVYAWSEEQFEGDVICSGEFTGGLEATGWIWGSPDYVSGQVEVYEQGVINSLYISFSAYADVPM